MAALLEIQHLTRRYGHRLALDDVSLTLAPGRTVCLVGENGAGKTTLLAIAAGVLSSDAGHVLAEGRHLEDCDAARRAVGYMADAPLVYDALSPRENLRFFAALYDLRRDDARDDRLLDRVGLLDRAAEPAGTLSAGLRRRLDLARVLLHEPRLLLLDEPVNALDADGVRVLTALLQAHRAAGGATLFTAHTAAEAADLAADDVLTLDRGRLRSANSAAEARA